MLCDRQWEGELLPSPFPADWESAWAPYDEGTYRAALAFIQPYDVVLDIGAGDLRFAVRAAECARHITAIEQHAHLLSTQPPTCNMAVICGDALRIPFPSGTTVGVLLMRHCQHVGIYARKLQAVGCERLITNARWGMSVEQIDLAAERLPFNKVTCGWFACLCGYVGFVPGKTTSSAFMETVHEVTDCPNC